MLQPEPPQLATTTTTRAKAATAGAAGIGRLLAPYCLASICVWLAGWLAGNSRGGKCFLRLSGLSCLPVGHLSEPTFCSRLSKPSQPVALACNPKKAAAAAAAKPEEIYRSPVGLGRKFCHNLTPSARTLFLPGPVWPLDTLLDITNRRRIAPLPGWLISPPVVALAARVNKHQPYWPALDI